MFAKIVSLLLLCLKASRSFQVSSRLRHRSLRLYSTEEGARVRISYCPGCRWMLRSAWYAQEILTTFDDGTVSEVTLAPQYAPPGGEFIVYVNDHVVWNRREDDGFPGAAELKQRIRNLISPDLDLGHSDSNSQSSS